MLTRSTRTDDNRSRRDFADSADLQRMFGLDAKRRQDRTRIIIRVSGGSSPSSGIDQSIDRSIDSLARSESSRLTSVDAPFGADGRARGRRSCGAVRAGFGHPELRSRLGTVRFGAGRIASSALCVCRWWRGSRFSGRHVGGVDGFCGGLSAALALLGVAVGDSSWWSLGGRRMRRRRAGAKLQAALDTPQL